MKILKSMFRIYVAPEELETTVAFYERLQQVQCERRLNFADMGIDVAVVGAFVLLGGNDATLEPVRHVRAAFVVDSIDEFAAWLPTMGATVPDEIHTSPVGRRIDVQHADGLVAEYFEPIVRADGIRS